MFLDLFSMYMHGAAHSMVMQYIYDCVPQFGAGMPSIRNPASIEKFSASVPTPVWFLQAHDVGQTYVIPLCTERNLMLVLSLLDFQQNRRLGMISACSQLLDFQRDSTVLNSLCDECS